jgi:hypothetical protein
MKTELSTYQQKAIERPGLSDIDLGHLQIAIQMMVNITYDNSMVNRFDPERTSTYPVKYVREISRTAGIYFDAHPELLTDENLDEICCGEETEVAGKFGIHPEYQPMSNALNEFFDPGSTALLT